MTCRNCGTEIADKAIVCYRCGTGTADPVRKPAEVRTRRAGLVPAVVLLLLALAAFFLGRQYHVFGLELVLPAGSSSLYSVSVSSSPEGDSRLTPISWPWRLAVAI